MWSSLPLCILSILTFLSSVAAQTPQPGEFFFQWPLSTTQCEVINATWTNATAPFRIFVM